MKKGVTVLLTAALMMLPAFPAQADFDYSQLDGMTTQELQALQEEIANRLENSEAEAETQASADTGQEAEIPADLADIEIGSEILFGKYEQDYNAENGLEDIEWIVLDKEGSRILVLTKYAIDQAYFHNASMDITWEYSMIRYVMNSNFLINYFTEEEQAMIPAVTVPADDNPEYSTGTAGNATEDHIFFLSIAEVEKYLPTPEDRICQSTTLTRSRGISENAWWWLRTPGEFRSAAASVYDDGSINYQGCAVTNYVVAAKPAMWIDLSKGTVKKAE